MRHLVECHELAFEETKPEHFYKLRLCDCKSWSDGIAEAALGIARWNEHGYCRYCGGFEPETIRRELGDDELLRKINLLAIHRRLKMLEICGFEVPDVETI